MAQPNEIRIKDSCMIADGWSSEISAAQLHATYWICGVEHQRVVFGDDDDPGHERCPDCGVARGQLHVPGCELEICPACGGQVISCECHYGRNHGRPAA